MDWSVHYIVGWCVFGAIKSINNHMNKSINRGIYNETISSLTGWDEGRHMDRYNSNQRLIRRNGSSWYFGITCIGGVISDN